MKTKAAYDLYFKLIAQFGQQTFDGYHYNRMVAPLRDTIELAVQYYDQIMGLRQNEALRYYAYNLVFNGLQKEALPVEQVAKSNDLFLQDAKAIVDKYDLQNAKDTMPYMDEFYPFRCAAHYFRRITHQRSELEIYAVSFGIA